MTDIKVLFDHATAVMQKAYAPYSKFYVGACIEATSGKLYAGCNVENAAYGLTTCAEACAICAMIVGSDAKINQIAVITSGSGMTAPCGACRQRIHEFATPDTLVHLGNLKGDRVTYHLSELLPHAFSMSDLTK